MSNYEELSVELKIGQRDTLTVYQLVQSEIVDSYLEELLIQLTDHIRIELRERGYRVGSK